MSVGQDSALWSPPTEGGSAQHHCQKPEAEPSLGLGSHPLKGDIPALSNAWYALVHIFIKNHAVKQDILRKWVPHPLPSKKSHWCLMSKLLSSGNWQDVYS